MLLLTETWKCFEQESWGSVWTMMVTGFHRPRDCLFSTIRTAISLPSERLGLDLVQA